MGKIKKPDSVKMNPLDTQNFTRTVRKRQRQPSGSDNDPVSTRSIAAGLASESEPEIVEVEETTDAEVKPRKKKKLRTRVHHAHKYGSSVTREKCEWKPEWLNKFPWLILVDKPQKIVGCKICQQGGTKINGWRTCSYQMKTWRMSAYANHQKTSDHQSALKSPVLSQEMTEARAQAIRNTQKGVMANMQLIFFSMQNELAIRKIQGLFNQIDFYAPGALSAMNRSSFAVYDIIIAINSAIENENNAKLRDCIAFTVHTDESTDAYETKKLIVYVDYVDQALNRHEKFAKLVELEELDATAITDKIMENILSTGVDQRKMVMFTSDGAAVMLGRRNGVAAQIRNRYGVTHLLSFHCICHRTALAMNDAMKQCPYLQTKQTFIAHLITFISLNRGMTSMRRLANAFDKVYIKLQRVFEIRWLSIAKSVRSVCRSYEAILLVLEDSSTTSPQAKGYYKTCKDAGFITELFMLNDVLQVLDKLSIKLQRANLHPFDSNKYVQDAILELKTRFWDDKNKLHCSLEARVAMSKLIILSDESTAQIKQANLNTRNLFDQNVTDEVTLQREWNDFKFAELKLSFTLKHNWRDTLNSLGSSRLDNGDPVYPNLSKLGGIIQAFSAQNATAERGFSLTNRLRTKLRNRLKVDTTDMLIRLALHNVDSREFDYTEAANIWLANRDRYGNGQPSQHGPRMTNARQPPSNLDEDDDDFRGFPVEDVVSEGLKHMMNFGWESDSENEEEGDDSDFE